MAIPASRTSSYGPVCINNTPCSISPGSAEEKPASPAAGPKHSHSIGELASLFPATQKPPAGDGTSEREPAESKEKVKHFWQRKQEASVSKPVEKEKPKSPFHEDVKSKPVQEKVTLPPKEGGKGGAGKRHRSASPVVEGSPLATPTKKLKESPEKTRKNFEIKKNPDSPPKWFRFSGKSQNQQRSRSESPEESKKGGRQETKTQKEHQQQHQLGVTASAAGGGGDASAEDEAQAQMNVLDRIKQYNTKDAAVIPGKGVGGSDSTNQAKGDKGKGKEEGKTKGRGEGKVKGREKGVEKDTRGKKKGYKEGVHTKGKEKFGDKIQDKKAAKKRESSSAKKETATGKHWNPFKKSQKHTDKAKDDRKKGRKAAKEEKGAGKNMPKDVESAELFAGVKNRIEKLKELGLETDGADGDEAVLLSVVKRPEDGEMDIADGEEMESEEEGWTEDSAESEEESEEGEEEVDFGGPGPEIRVPSPESGVPSPEDRTPSPDAVSVEVNVMDKVKKLQTMHDDSAISSRARSFTETKRYV